LPEIQRHTREDRGTDFELDSTSIDARYRLDWIRAAGTLVGSSQSSLVLALEPFPILDIMHHIVIVVVLVWGLATTWCA
jgi:hypothetical protein